MTLYEINYILQQTFKTIKPYLFQSFSLFFFAAKQLDPIPDISFHENKKRPTNIECRGGLSIKKEQAGWRQLGFSIQFSCPEPWQTG